MIAVMGRCVCYSHATNCKSLVDSGVHVKKSSIVFRHLYF